MDAFRFEKGDKVIIKDMDVSSDYFSPESGKYRLGFTSGMSSYVNRICTIEHVLTKDYGYMYLLKEVGFYWTNEFLKPATKPKSNLEARRLLSKEE